MKIEIDLENDSRLVNLSRDDIKFIFEIGKSVYFNGMEFHIRKQIEEEHKELEIKYKNFTNELENELKYKREHCEEKLSLYKTYTDDLNKNTIETKDALIQNLQERLANAENNIRIKDEEFREQINTLVKLESLIGKGSTIDNAQKGNFGEEFVNKHILNWYPESVIIDKSHEDKKGDLHWFIDNNEFKCLVEVKNVQYVRPEDVSKFKRDMKETIANDEINCGLFVSLKTETIPNIGKFSVEYINGVPILFVCGIYVEVELLRFAFSVIIKLASLYIKSSEFQEKSDDITNKFENDAKNFISDSFNEWSKLNVIYKTNEDSINKLITNNTNMKSLMDLVISKLNSICSEYNIENSLVGRSEISKSDTLKSDMINAVYNYYSKHKKFPKVSELSQFSENQFRGELAMKKLKSIVNTMIAN
tara:strand:- start:1160 stop:2419 length:1260 start_codon:yes stop_codon:yes gene_type:complete